jgi:hypothetical protein
MKKMERGEEQGTQRGWSSTSICTKKLLGHVYFLRQEGNAEVFLTK